MTGSMPWVERAACRDVFDPELWFTSDPVLRAQAVDTCRACPVQRPCGEYARTQKIQGITIAGVWGGITEKQRRAEQRRRTEARDAA